MSTDAHPSRTFHERPLCRRRVPRAGIEPIARPDQALAVVSAAIHRPARHETIVITLDDRRRGRGLVVVSATVRPDSVLDVVDCVVQAFDGESGGLIVATIRPDAADDLGDAERWRTMSAAGTAAGVTLVEWFVIDRDVTCPRELTGDPPRW